MKNSLLLLALAAGTFCAKAQSDADMKAWMAYMTPGVEHKQMASADGVWTQEVTMWMDPSQPPVQSKSEATCSMIMDGRYQETHTKGEFNGMPFNGYSLVGFDNARKVYQSTWIDNMGTGMMFMEGTMDMKTHVIHFTGTSTDPMSGKVMKCREDWTIVDDKTQKMEMWMTPPAGKEFKTMEITMRKNG